MWSGNFIIGERTFRNNLTRSGVNHIIKALGAGTHQPAVTHLYVRYGAELAEGLDSKDLTAVAFRDFRNLSTAGCAFIPLLCPAFYTKSNLAGTFENKVEFRFTIPFDDIAGEEADGVWHYGAKLTNAATVHALGVVSAQSFNDRGSDTMIAASVLLAGNQFALMENTLTPCTYTVTLEP